MALKLSVVERITLLREAAEVAIFEPREPCWALAHRLAEYAEILVLTNGGAARFAQTAIGEDPTGVCPACGYKGFHMAWCHRYDPLEEEARIDQTAEELLRGCDLRGLTDAT